MPKIKKTMNTRQFLLLASAGEQIIHFTTKFAVCLQLEIYKHDWRTEYQTALYYVDVFDLTTMTAYQIGNGHTRAEILDLARDPIVRDVIHVPFPDDGVTTPIFELIGHVRNYIVPSKKALRSKRTRRL